MTFEFLIFNKLLNINPPLTKWPNDQYLWAVDSMRRERKVGLLIKTSSSVVDSVIFYYPCCLKCNIPISSHPRSASLSAQLVIFQLSAIVFRPFGINGIMNKRSVFF